MDGEPTTEVADSAKHNCAAETDKWTKATKLQAASVFFTVITAAAAVCVVLLNNRGLTAANRAWVVLQTDLIRIEPCPPRKGSFVTPCILNAGKTPARNARSRVRVGYAPIPRPGQQINLDEFLEQPLGGPSVIGPNQIHDLATELQADMLPGMTIFVMGQVTYDSGFGGGRLRFCAYKVGGDQPGTYRFLFCENGNDVE